MQELAVYGAIGGALVTTIGVLWRKLEASEQRERDLYRELLKDTETLRAISQRMEAGEERDREHTGLLTLVAERLASLESLLRPSADPRGETAA